MSFYIKIIADTNDADYVESLSEIEEEDLEIIKPVIEAIKNFQPSKDNRHNYPKHEYAGSNVRELYGHLEGFDYFDELVPHGEDGIHSITEIKLFHVTKVEPLY